MANPLVNSADTALCPYKYSEDFHPNLYYLPFLFFVFDFAEECFIALVSVPKNIDSEK